jgi:hypothetical protein
MGSITADFILLVIHTALTGFAISTLIVGELSVSLHAFYCVIAAVNIAFAVLTIMRIGSR